MRLFVNMRHEHVIDPTHLAVRSNRIMGVCVGGRGFGCVAVNMSMDSVFICAGLQFGFGNNWEDGAGGSE